MYVRMYVYVCVCKKHSNIAYYKGSDQLLYYLVFSVCLLCVCVCVCVCACKRVRMRAYACMYKWGMAIK